MDKSIDKNKYFYQKITSLYSVASYNCNLFYFVVKSLIAFADTGKHWMYKYLNLKGETMLKKLILWFVVAALAVTLTGCHTIGGFGKDLQDVTDKYTQR